METDTTVGESPNVGRATTYEAQAGVPEATWAPKQASNGEEGALWVPRPLREDTGRNTSEARCSVVRHLRSDTEEGSAETLLLSRRRNLGWDSDGMTIPRLPGVPGPACVEGSLSDYGRPVRVPQGGGRSGLSRPTSGRIPGVRGGIRGNLERRPEGRTGVGGVRSSEEAVVMAVDAKGPYFGEAEGGARGHPIRREA